MAESANLMLKARDLLATPNQEGLAIVIDQLFTHDHRDTNEYQSARTLYNFCFSKFSNCLTLMLLKVYQSPSTNSILRFRSIALLSEALIEFRNRGFDLSIIALNEIKPLLISCLTLENSKESDVKILGVIVSLVAYNGMVLDNGGWDELGDCILLLANTEPLKAFHVFLDLPPVYKEFIDRFLCKLVEEVYKVLLLLDDKAEEDWSLALQTAVKLGIQLLDCDMRFDLTREILCNVVKSGDELVKRGKEVVLQRGLEHLEKFLVQEVTQWKYSSKQCVFVAEFACRIAEIGRFATTKEAAKKIYLVVAKLQNDVYDPAFKRLEFYNSLKPYSALEILSAFARTDPDDDNDNFREMVIRRLLVLLCDHTSKKAEIDVEEIRKLKPLLISCLKEEGTPENTFKILAQVVFHVALETFRVDKDHWFDLWDYIASSKSETQFKKLVYIFQSLTMRLDNKAFVIPAINNLLPEIHNRLSQLDNNTCWFLAFTGAFCTIIHLLEIESHAGYVREVAYKMVDSVKEIVEKKMEVGFVMRGFRDLESIVKKQLEWYESNEYRFVKGLLWKFYGIKGMRMESRVVLWRINVVLEREVKKEHKVLPKNEFDWLNQSET